MTTRNQRRLRQAFQQAVQEGAVLTTWHARAAHVLLAVNGLDSALAYLAGLTPNRERALLVCVFCGHVHIATRRCAACGTLLCPVCDRAALCPQCRSLAALLELLELLAPSGETALEIVLGTCRRGVFQEQELTHASN